LTSASAVVAISFDDEDSTIIADEEEGDQDVADIIGDVSGDEET
jgi:hypothetical protein